MKLGRINNFRCSEAEAATYVIVPDNITQEHFEDLVHKAQDEYEEVLAMNPLAKYNPWGIGAPTLEQLRSMPGDRTVGEVLAERDRNEEVRKAQEKITEMKRRSFGYYLEKQGLKLVQREEFDFETDTDWGHKHGVRIHYDGIPFNWSWEPDPEGNELCAKT